MKSVLLVGLFGVLVTLSYAAKSAHSEGPESRADLVRGQERGDKGGHGGGGGGGGGGHHGGGGGGGGGHGGGGGEGHSVYHETAGQELFQGEEWMLLVPLVLIPLIILGCWYFMGGKGGGDDGWGWDRMGYSDTNTVGGTGSGYNSGSYDTRSFVPADSMDKSTHQRIMNSIQQ
ncbi:cold and drought-regulated protein CORA [Folsomia candida]|uniref:cold and drought-regulated protein CORA n=1 Tax=Folsomia candida TaxID=158441 RepID=UPI000B8F89BE|nr:cold and drought-regulated protein CORA [Folsomia candida]XP_021955585.1 cold and drought-regulated protein CORA [Folsomia candida]